jgi:hypothetical protein
MKDGIYTITARFPLISGCMCLLVRQTHNYCLIPLVHVTMKRLCRLYCENSKPMSISRIQTITPSMLRRPLPPLAGTWLHSPFSLEKFGCRLWHRPGRWPSSEFDTGGGLRTVGHGPRDRNQAIDVEEQDERSHDADTERDVVPSDA